MGFTPCRAEPDIWMRRNGNVYKYIAVYVDDLAIAAKTFKVGITNVGSPYFKTIELSKEEN